MKHFSYAWQSFKAESKQSDQRLSLFTHWILIVFLLTLTLFSVSIQNYLQQNLNNLLGSDLVISRYQPLSIVQQNELAQFADKLSVTKLQNITLTFATHYQQAQLKLVDEVYPIQGKLSIGDSPQSIHQAASKGPNVGEIWLDSRLFAALRLSPGDRLVVGGSNLKVTKILFHEPDRIMEGHSVAMRALAHHDSFIKPLISDSTQYRYLLETSKEPQIAQWVKAHLPDASIISKATSRHPLAGFWQRVENFIGLAAVILFFMAAIAIDLVGRRQLKQESYRQALYQSMGLTITQGISITLTKWVIGILMITIPAIIVAPFLVWILVDSLQQTFNGLQVYFDIGKVALTLLLVFALALSFQIPNFWQLKQTSVVSLIRQQSQPKFILVRSVWILLSISILAAWYSDNPLLTSMMLTSIGATILLIIALTFISLKSIERITRNNANLFSFSVFMMNQRLISKSTQIMGIGLCITLLLFSLMLMRDFGNQLERNTRSNDGNLIISQASQQQVDTIQQWARQFKAEIRQLRPYSRAKLIKINGIDRENYVSHPSDSMSTLANPIRLSWSDPIPKNNEVVQGEWWHSKPENWQQISVEDEIMTDLKLKLGDQLTFFIEGQSYSFTIVSSHLYKAGEGSVTFWFQIPQTARQWIKSQSFYMGSMEIPENAWEQLSSLWQQHPTIGLLPLKEMTKNFDDMLALLTKSIVGFSSIVLLMAIIVISASVKGFEQDEQKKNGLLLSLGLDQKHCLQLTLHEWLLTAIIACFGAILGCWIAGELMYQSQFSLTYSPDIVWLVMTLMVVVTGVVSLGYGFNRSALKTSVKDLIVAQ